MPHGLNYGFVEEWEALVEFQITVLCKFESGRKRKLLSAIYVSAKAMETPASGNSATSSTVTLSNLNIVRFLPIAHRDRHPKGNPS